MVRRSLFALSLLLVGCGGGGGSKPDDAKDATARLRLFNGSRQANLGLTLNGTDANGLAKGADFGDTANYRFVADSTYRLGLATNGGAGTTLATVEGANFEPGLTYGGFASGNAGEGLLFAPLSIRVDQAPIYPVVQIIDLLETGRHALSIYRNGRSVSNTSLDSPGRSDFSSLLDESPEIASYTFSLATDDADRTPIGRPFSFDLDLRRPVTLIVYGTATAPRYAVLYGVFVNPTTQQG